MRLLNTMTLELHEFFGFKIPEYAILSRRWEEEEVTYQDLVAGRGPNMKGYSKVKNCCEQALSDGWQWAWIDTCCIDKSSSAELSEAINSMFQWYRQARVCYVYLSDVPHYRDVSQHQVQGSSFRRSQWFTRGWTLQELLAPEYLVFFDFAWQEIGTKSCLADVLSSITGIKELQNYKSACIARKMSWASARRTTRTEDQAYSLLGIFGVNMPLLYGEGERAFFRLQLEIIKNSDDESIFAWFDSRGGFEGLIAHSVRSFRSSGDIQLLQNRSSGRPYTMTNKGLHIVASLIRWKTHLHQMHLKYS